MKWGHQGAIIVADSDADCHTILRFSLPNLPNRHFVCGDLTAGKFLEHHPIAPLQVITAHLT